MSRASRAGRAGRAERAERAGRAGRADRADRAEPVARKRKSTRFYIFSYDRKNRHKYVGSLVICYLVLHLPISVIRGECALRLGLGLSRGFLHSCYRKTKTKCTRTYLRPRERRFSRGFYALPARFQRASVCCYMKLLHGVHRRVLLLAHMLKFFGTMSHVRPGRV